MMFQTYDITLYNISYDCNHIPLFFLKNQQFITQNVRADCGSYFITIYITSRLYEERNRKKNKKADREEKKEKIKVEI